MPGQHPLDQVVGAQIVDERPQVLQDGDRFRMGVACAQRLPQEFFVPVMGEVEQLLFRPSKKR